MFEFNHTLVAHSFCPACAYAAQEGGFKVAYMRGVLCSYHRGRFAALLRDTRASQQSIYYWLEFLRKP